MTDEMLWTSVEERVLDRLVDIAEERCDGSREAVVSLQGKLRASGGVAAIVLGLELNALGLLDPGGHAAALVLLVAGAVGLIGSLVVATWAGRPVVEPGLGSVIRWGKVLRDQGGAATQAHLVESYERVLGHWQPVMSRYARLAATAQWLLAAGLSLASLGAVLARL